MAVWTAISNNFKLFRMGLKIFDSTPPNGDNQGDILPSAKASFHLTAFRRNPLSHKYAVNIF